MRHFGYAESRIYFYVSIVYLYTCIVTHILNFYIYFQWRRLGLLSNMCRPIMHMNNK